MRYLEHQNKKISFAGLGTTGFWHGRNSRLEECILTAVSDYGVSVLDTAEMYGKSEHALKDVMRKAGRENIFLVDKILPEHINVKDFSRSLENSLTHLGTDYIDLYLLHWREDADLHVLVEQMHRAKAEGKIRKWGVSNFDTCDLRDLLDCDGSDCFCNQVFHCVYERGCEVELLPYMKEHGILPMAYSSLGSNYHPHPDIRKNKAVMEMCRIYDIPVENVMLKLLQDMGVITLFSTSSLSHLHDNLRDIPEEAYSAVSKVLVREFPAPEKGYPLVKI